jgi:hypothetical protein
MKLFRLVNNLPEASEEALLIKEFKKLISRDRSQSKETGIKELGFVHFYTSFDSRFQMYKSEEERIEAIKTVLGLNEKWKPDSEVRLAIERYSYMMNTESMDLVLNARKAIGKLQDFLDQLDLTERNRTDNYMFSAKDLQSVIKELPNTIRALNDAKSVVEKEIEDKFSTGVINSRSLVTKIVGSSTKGNI